MPRLMSASLILCLDFSGSSTTDSVRHVKCDGSRSHSFFNAIRIQIAICSVDAAMRSISNRRLIRRIVKRHGESVLVGLSLVYSFPGNFHSVDFIGTEFIFKRPRQGEGRARAGARARPPPWRGPHNFTCGPVSLPVYPA